MAKKNVISELASVGEDALEKLAHSGATRKAVQGAMQLKEKGERFVHTFDSIDERLTKIERRLTALEKAGKATTTGATAAKASKTPAVKAAVSKPRASTGKAKPAA